MLRNEFVSKLFLFSSLLLSLFSQSCSKNYVMPQINIEGDLTDISHDKEVDITATYKGSGKNFSTSATLKWQGGSSLAYEKKNYTIKFDKKIKLVNSWGKQKKYCLKANYIDYSQARNVVSAKLYGQIAKTRKNKDEYSKLVNGGAIDGYPIVINIDGDFHGVYTLNIPKDEWCFKMDDDNSNQAIVFGSEWTDVVALRQEMSDVFSKKGDVIDGLELEYCSNKNCGWVTESFNKMIRFLNQTSDPNVFKNQINNYINLDRSIDTMLYTQFIYAADNTSKNIIWTTYDGNIWSPNVYDLDDTWGLDWQGFLTWGPNDFLPNESKDKNLLWSKLYSFYNDEIKERYVQLRKKVLNLKNIAKTFENFNKKIKDEYKELEKEKWIDVPSKDTNNIEQIIDFAQKRIEVFDRYFQVNI